LPGEQEHHGRVIGDDLFELVVTDLGDDAVGTGYYPCSAFAFIDSVEFEQAGFTEEVSLVELCQDYLFTVITLCQYADRAFDDIVEAAGNIAFMDDDFFGIIGLAMRELQEMFQRRGVVPVDPLYIAFAVIRAGDMQ